MCHDHLLIDFMYSSSCCIYARENMLEAMAGIVCLHGKSIACINLQHMFAGVPDMAVCLLSECQPGLALPPGSHNPAGAVPQMPSLSQQQCILLSWRPHTLPHLPQTLVRCAAGHMSTSSQAATAVARAPACRPCSAAWASKHVTQAELPRPNSSSRPAAPMLWQLSPCGTLAAMHSTLACLAPPSPLSAGSPSPPPHSPSETLQAER